MGSSMLVLVGLSASASLLDTSSWNPAGRRGKRAEPDYLSIAGASAAVPIPSDLPTVVMDKAEIGLRKMMRAAYNSPRTAYNCALNPADYLNMIAQAAAEPLKADLPAAVVQKAESGLRRMQAAYNSAPDYAKIAGGLVNSVSINELATRINEVPAVLPSVVGSIAQAAAEPLKADLPAAVVQKAESALKAATEPLKADLPAAVVQKAESGLRRMQAAYNSAPDYAKIAGGLVSSAWISNELASRINEVPAVLPSVVESGLRKMRDAYDSAPDYRDLVDTVLGVANGEAGQMSSDADAFDCFGFPVDLRPRTEAMRQVPFWRGDSDTATPDYGNIAMGTSLIGHGVDDAEMGSIF